MTTPESEGFAALDFYSRFYEALPRSQAYSELCRQLYGADFGQHGFSDMSQLQALLQVIRLEPVDRALDIGCGDGRIAEYISDHSGAHITGLDLIPAGIACALQRTEPKRDRLDFVAADIGALASHFPAGSFDALISIDSLYFADLTETVRQMKILLRPGGRMAIFYSHGADPWHSIESFPRDTIHPESGPLAAALRANGLQYEWWDFTEADYEHAKRKKAIIEALRTRYETDEDRFLCESRMGEADGVIAAYEAGVQARHLFLACT